MRKIIFAILFLCLSLPSVQAQNIWNGNIAIGDSVNLDRWLAIAAANTGTEHRLHIAKSISYIKNATVGANVTMVFTQDGYLTMTGVTLTVNGEIEAPSVQITDGTITFGSGVVEESDPVWTGGTAGPMRWRTNVSAAAANETRYLDNLVTMTVDPAGNAEVSAFYSRINRTAGSNGVYTINGIEGVAGSSYADEAGTFRGGLFRTYTAAGATATMRTAIGAEFSARAGYSGGTDCVVDGPPAGTAFVGARIWMAPYFTSGSLQYLNNFWGLWIYGGHSTQRNGDAAIKISDAGGGFTADIILQGGDAITNATAGTITTDADVEIDGSVHGLNFVGAYTSAALDFSDVVLNHGGSAGPVMLRAGTYNSPVTSADAGQSGMIRLYSRNSALTDTEATGFYDRGVFVAMKTTGAKGQMAFGGLVEVETTVAGEGPTNVKGGEFIVNLINTGSKLGNGIMYGIWAKITAKDGATTHASSKKAAIWADNQMNGNNAAPGEEYGIFATTGGLRPDGFIGFETTAAGYDQLLYFDTTFNSGAGTMVTTDAVPGGNQDARIKVWYNGTQYYIPLYR